MAADEPTTIVGLFSTQGDAERAVNQLVHGGIPAGDIGFLRPGEAQEPDYAKSAAAGVGGGAVIGAIAGGLLGAASMVVAPGIGPIVTAGAWLPPLMGIATGGATGGTAGGLFALSGTEDQGLHFRQAVQSGRSLVNVTTARSDEARALMEQAGALEVADLGRSQSAEKIADEESQTK